MPERPDLRLVVVGLVAGAASGLLGVGGGIVIVPGLVLLLRMPQRRAHATSLAAIIPIGVVGAVTYVARGDAHGALAGLLAAGSLVGALLGVRALARAPEPVLRFVFAAVALASSIRLLAASADTGALPPQPIAAGEAAIALGVGLGAGVFAGLLGVGGGIVMVPAMTVLLGQGQHVAQGTSLVVIVVTALAATRATLKRDLVERRAAIILGAAGLGAAVGGALVAAQLSDAVLRRVFGAFLVAVVLRLATQRRAKTD